MRPKIADATIFIIIISHMLTIFVLDCLLIYLHLWLWSLLIWGRDELLFGRKLVRGCNGLPQIAQLFKLWRPRLIINRSFAWVQCMTTTAKSAALSRRITQLPRNNFVPKNLTVFATLRLHFIDQAFVYGHKILWIYRRSDRVTKFEFFKNATCFTNHICRGLFIRHHRSNLDIWGLQVWLLLILEELCDGLSCRLG